MDDDFNASERLMERRDWDRNRTRRIAPPYSWPPLVTSRQGIAGFDHCSRPATIPHRQSCPNDTVLPARRWLRKLNRDCRRSGSQRLPFGPCSFSSVTGPEHIRRVSDQAICVRDVRNESRVPSSVHSMEVIVSTRFSRTRHRLREVRRRSGAVSIPRPVRFQHQRMLFPSCRRSLFIWTVPPVHR